MLTQPQISDRLAGVYQISIKPYESHCQCCFIERAIDRDHTISQRQCKIIKRTELIWSEDNWSLSCRTCHSEWESYKSGLFTKHHNFIERMLFMKDNDPSGFKKRMIYVIDQNQIRKLL